MTVQYLTNTKGKKTGVFLSISDWDQIQKELELLHKRISQIDQKRKLIRFNFIKSKKESKKFSSDQEALKAMLK